MAEIVYVTKWDLLRVVYIFLLQFSKLVQWRSWWLQFLNGTSNYRHEFGT